MRARQPAAGRKVGAAPAGDPAAQARAAALRALAVRARTEREIRTRLAERGLEAQAEATVAWLKGLGYLDDRAFARERARGLLAPGKLGPRAAERKLLAAGLAAELARGAVDEALRGESGRTAARAERELCRELAERRAGGPLDGLDDRARARLARFLVGRGFAGPVVAAVLGLYSDGE